MALEARAGERVGECLPIGPRFRNEVVFKGFSKEGLFITKA